MTVIIDPQNSGISGNMVVGALVDMGLDPKALIQIMEYYASYFGDVEVNIGKLKKSGISASYVDVNSNDNGSVKYTELLEMLEKVKHPDVTADMMDFSRRVFKTLAEAEARVHG